MMIKVIKIPSLLVFIALAGCATVQVTHTARSSIEQRLLISSLERAMTALGTELLQGISVAIDFYGLGWSLFMKEKTTDGDRYGRHLH